ncbi:MAG: hypothetical protein COA42_05070 [Alteromonadaceae bacterium]|nr:MAG: hypothetical protein COA42_05070 [Alteromonadaceae bacterium]
MMRGMRGNMSRQDNEPVEQKLTKRQIQKAATRKNILAKTRDLFIKEGLSGIKASAIAKQAGIGEGTIFAHFGDINALLSEVNQIETEVYLNKARKSIDENNSVEDNLLSYTFIIMSYYVESSGTLLRHTIFTLSRDHNNLEKLVIRSIKDYIDILRLGVASGELKADTDIKAYGDICYSVAISNIIAGLRFDKFDFEQRYKNVKHNLMVLLEGLRR